MFLVTYQFQSDFARYYFTDLQDALNFIAKNINSDEYGNFQIWEERNLIIDVHV